MKSLTKNRQSFDLRISSIVRDFQAFDLIEDLDLILDLTVIWAKNTKNENSDADSYTIF